VIQDIGPTVGQTQGEHIDNHGTQKATGPRNGCQLDTGVLVHNDSIMKRMTNGYISVISHDTKENTFNHPKGEREVQLNSTTEEWDSLLSPHHVGQHLWDISGCVANVQKGQICKKEVHGGLETRLYLDNDDDNNIPNH
jgi:hypothetical protein